MLKRLASEDRTYVTLDDLDTRLLAKQDPRLFLQRHKPPILIDEIQYAPQLLPYIKMDVDSTGKRGEYWLIGSQAFHLMKGVSESLAGRVGIVKMLGLSRSELDGIHAEPFSTDFAKISARVRSIRPRNLASTWQHIFNGSMPGIYAEPRPDWERFYASYVATYIQRDIRDLTQVADESTFFNFLVAAAARTAKPIVYEEIARDAGISATTVKKWISIL